MANPYEQLHNDLRHFAEKFDRLEAKVDRLADKVDKVLVDQARTEEKFAAIGENLDRHHAIISSHATRISKLELNSGSNGQALRFAERVFWIILAASVTWAFRGW